jgi:hypothetical protein
MAAETEMAQNPGFVEPSKEQAIVELLIGRKPAMAVNMRHISENPGDAVRERMNGEFSNNAVLGALFMSFIFPLLVDPPDFDVETDDVRFRVFMYATSMALSCYVFSTLTSVTLLYQLNMMPGDKQVASFICLLHDMVPRFLGLPNGLPDILVIFTGIGGLSMMVMISAALHMTVSTLDAWMMTAMVIIFGYVPMQVIALKIDNWKWETLNAMA